MFTFRVRIRVLMLVSGIAAVTFSALGSHVVAFVAWGVLFALPCFSQPAVGALDVFRPCVGLSVLVLLYSFSVVFFVDSSGVDYYGNQASSADIYTFKAAAFLAIIGISFGSWLPGALKTRRHAYTPQRGGPASRGIEICAVAFGALFIWSIYDRFLPWMATAYGDVALTSRLEASANLYSGPTEILTVVWPETLIICAAVQIFFDRQKKHAVRGFAILLFGGYVLTMALSGWRGQMMFGILIFGLYYHYRVHAITVGRAAGLGLAVYFVINLMSVARVSSNPIEMARVVLEEFDARGVALISIANSGELLTSTNLLTVIDGINSGSSEFKLGALAMSQLAAFLPRGLFPERPGFGSEQFTQVFFPDVAAAGGGYGFFFSLDGYWDFGLFGVLLYSVLFSFALEIFYGYFRKNAHSNLVLFLYALAYSQLVMMSVRGGMFASVKGAVISCSPLLVPWLLAKFPAGRSINRSSARVRGEA